MYPHTYRFRFSRLPRVGLSLLLLSAAAAICSGQSEPKVDENAAVSEDSVQVSVSDQKMKAVVDQILRAEFRTVKGPKRVEIYDPLEGKGGYGRLEETWLPKMPGVRFVLLTEAELNRRASSGKRPDVYFFTKLEVSDGRYKIGFAKGDPFCSYSGGDWAFNMIGRVRVVRLNTGFGAGCCYGSGQ